VTHNHNGLPGIVCVMGPTGSGKNDLALKLKQEFSIEIINFDSRQVYADLPIVTAQPSEWEKQSCPHHLYGFLGLREKISAGRFVDMARQAITEVSNRGRIPFLVGGTGLYLRSLIHGLAHIPDVPEKIQTELENESSQSGVDSIYQRLVYVDPVYAGTITPRDRQKIIRALGVSIATGKIFSDWHKEQGQKTFYHALKIGITWELEELAPRLRQRIAAMVKSGAIEEVEKAWIKCKRDPGCPGLSGIGCREILSYINKQTDLDQTIDLWVKNTRAYAKRQLTWFRKEPDIFWVKPGEAKKAAALVNDFLRQ
jgi:tRNA dimethylallyltransferase